MGFKKQKSDRKKLPKILEERKYKLPLSTF